MGYPVAVRNALHDAQIVDTTTYYIALYSVAPNDEGVGGTEFSGGSYARVAASSWPASSGGEKSNGADIVFPEATADWGAIAAVAWMTASSGGTQKAVTDSTITQEIVTGVTLTIEAGALTLDAA